MDKIILKIRMSKSDLQRFQKFVDDYGDDLSVGIRRKKSLEILLDNNIHEYIDVKLVGFSSIDGFPIICTTFNGDLQKSLLNGDLISFTFIEPGVVTLDYIKEAIDYGFNMQ